MIIASLVIALIGLFLVAKAIWTAATDWEQIEDPIQAEVRAALHEADPDKYPPVDPAAQPERRSLFDNINITALITGLGLLLIAVSAYTIADSGVIDNAEEGPEETLTIAAPGGDPAEVLALSYLSTEEDGVFTEPVWNVPEYGWPPIPVSLVELDDTAPKGTVKISYSTCQPSVSTWWLPSTCDDYETDYFRISVPEGTKLPA